METIKKYYVKEEKDEIKKNFLIIPEKFKKYIESDETIYWIYKISNNVNNCVYIGKTKDINIRAMNYINEYLKGDGDRKINRAFQEIGLENFKMEPLEVTSKPESSCIKEKYYIDLYDSIDNGYNTSMNSAIHRKVKNETGHQHTIYSKVIRSKLVACVNTIDKKIVFSTGLKLFGDLIGRSKDEVKSAAKRETRLEKYFIYYLNKTDFDNQINAAKLKIEKNSIYSDCNLQYPDFVKYGEYIKSILKNGIKSNEENFRISFITQSNNIVGYDELEPDKFIEYYKSVPFSIIE